MRLFDYLKKLEVGTKVKLEVIVDNELNIIKDRSEKLFACLKSNVLTLDIKETQTHNNQWQHLTIKAA